MSAGRRYPHLSSSCSQRRQDPAGQGGRRGPVSLCSSVWLYRGAAVLLGPGLPPSRAGSEPSVDPRWCPSLEGACVPLLAISGGLTASGSPRPGSWQPPGAWLSQGQGPLRLHAPWSGLAQPEGIPIAGKKRTGRWQLPPGPRWPHSSRCAGAKNRSAAGPQRRRLGRGGPRSPTASGARPGLRAKPQVSQPCRRQPRAGPGATWGAGGFLTPLPGTGRAPSHKRTPRACSRGPAHALT